jgi:hypothetical protein
MPWLAGGSAASLIAEEIIPRHGPEVQKRLAVPTENFIAAVQH